ncbi:hypothetical protein LSO9J_20104 [Candidatus Liberibacter solanacearum]
MTIVVIKYDHIFNQIRVYWENYRLFNLNLKEPYQKIWNAWHSKYLVSQNKKVYHAYDLL